jgi:hypothetical protein
MGQRFDLLAQLDVAVGRGHVLPGVNYLERSTTTILSDAVGR